MQNTEIIKIGALHPQFQLGQQPHLAKLPILNSILLSLLSYSLKNPISLLQIEDNLTYLYLLHL